MINPSKMIEQTHEFPTRRGAWDFVRQCDAQGILAGYPSLGPAPYTVRILVSPKVGSLVRVIRDSSDLGLDAGIEAEIIAVEGGKMDLSITTLDMTLAGVSVGHPDLEIVSEDSMARTIDDLARAYASKYVADDGPRPATEESMREVCRNCVRPPKPEIAQRAAELVNALQTVKLGDKVRVRNGRTVWVVVRLSEDGTRAKISTGKRSTMEFTSDLEDAHRD